MYNKLKTHFFKKSLWQQLVWAIEHSETAQAIQIINVIEPCELNKTSSSLWHTPLMKAILYNLDTIAKELIPKMSNEGINEIDFCNNTSLHLAVERGMFDTCAMLIPRMSYKTIHAVDMHSYTAIEYAIKLKHYKIAALIDSTLLLELAPLIGKINDATNEDNILDGIG